MSPFHRRRRSKLRVKIKHRLILFTRYPTPGTAKTRLIPALGAEGAAALQRQMTEHTSRQVRKLLALRSLSIEIHFTGDKAAIQTWLGTDWDYQPQTEGDLGDRLIHAFRSAFDQGMERVVVIGTDCPGLDAYGIEQAFQALEQQDLVLGDALDGGYYLIGLRRLHPDLFISINWSTNVVRAQTVAIAERLGLSIAHLPLLADVDYPEDLPVWEALQNRPSVSVIVPVLNEAESLKTWQQPEGEWILVDGGSQDETIALAENLGIRIIRSEPGRSRQMNWGAAIAHADILLFLHADTQLPADFLAQIQQTLAQPGVVAGAFGLAIAGDQPGLRWVEWGVEWRSRCWQMPYGDQGIFLKAETFWKLGGFADLPIMEDFELVKRLQKLGKIAIVPATVTTSARRWEKLGVFKTTVINQLMVVAYYLGVPGDRLARFYRQR
jgi:uncharacterized protein